MVTSCEFTYSLVAISAELVMSARTNLHGSAFRFSGSFYIWKSLNKAGINFCLMTLSKSNMKFSMFSRVFTKNVNLCLHLDANAEYAVRGWIFETKENSVIINNSAKSLSIVGGLNKYDFYLKTDKIWYSSYHIHIQFENCYWNIRFYMF